MTIDTKQRYLPRPERKSPNTLQEQNQARVDAGLPVIVLKTIACRRCGKSTTDSKSRWFCVDCAWEINNSEEQSIAGVPQAWGVV